MPLCPPHFPTNQSTLSGFIYLVVDVYAWKSVEAFLKRSKVKSCTLFSSQAQPFFFFFFFFGLHIAVPSPYFGFYTPIQPPTKSYPHLLSSFLLSVFSLLSLSFSTIYVTDVNGQSLCVPKVCPLCRCG